MKQACRDESVAFFLFPISYIYISSSTLTYQALNYRKIVTQASYIYFGNKTMITMRNLNFCEVILYIYIYIYVYILFFVFLILLDFSTCTVRWQLLYNYIFLRLDFPLTTTRFYFFVYILSHSFQSLLGFNSLCLCVSFLFSPNKVWHNINNFPNAHYPTSFTENITFLARDLTAWWGNHLSWPLQRFQPCQLGVCGAA